MKDNLNKNIKKANLIKQESIIPKNISLPLKNWRRREHQVRAYLIGISLNNVALFMEQRTGKTPVSIAIAGSRFLSSQVKRLLVVCPLAVVGGWEKEFKKLANFPYRLEILEGKLENRKSVVANWKDTDNELQVLVTNYDIMSKISVDKESGASTQEGLMVDLKKWKPDIIICDESQRIKNNKSRRSKSMHRLGTVAKYRVILTGTPITQSPLDIFSQYKFLDPHIFGTSFSRFRNRYTVMRSYRSYQILGYKILPGDPYYDKNLEREFFKKVHEVAFRITRNEVSGLPPTEPQTLYATLERKAQKIYKEMKSSALLRIGQGIITAPIILTQLLRLQQITGGFINTESGETYQVSKAKLKILESRLKDLLEDNKKTVIFARFTSEITAISTMLKKKKISHHVLEGKVKRSLRDQMIEDFQNNPLTMVLVVQISTGGEGITLSSGKAEIFYSVNFSLTDYEQAKARIMDMDSVDKEVYNIVVKDTIDEIIIKTLSNKRNIAKLVVDDLKNLFLH